MGSEGQGVNPRFFFGKAPHRQPSPRSQPGVGPTEHPPGGLSRAGRAATTRSHLGSGSPAAAVPRGSAGPGHWEPVSPPRHRPISRLVTQLERRGPEPGGAASGRAGGGGSSPLRRKFGAGRRPERRRGAEHGWRRREPSREPAARELPCPGLPGQRRGAMGDGGALGNGSAGAAPANGTALPPPGGHNIAALVLGIVLILLIVGGNGLVCLSVCTERALKTTTNYFIVSLAVADLLLALLVLPLYVYSEVRLLGHCGLWVFCPGILKVTGLRGGTGRRPSLAGQRCCLHRPAAAAAGSGRVLGSPVLPGDSRPASASRGNAANARSGDAAGRLPRAGTASLGSPRVADIPGCQEQMVRKGQTLCWLQVSRFW